MPITTKICGITNVDDAQATVQAKADFVGLNFYAKSKRFVPVEAARSIAAAVGDQVELAGVFVNATADSIIETVNEVGLRYVQLHGDETTAHWNGIANRLPNTKLIRAIRVFGSDWNAALEQATAWKQAGAAVLLFDAGSDADYGGTGEVLDWRQVADLDLPRPWWLAGGLNPNNVAAAIELAQPNGVDVASGVESAPGSKDPSLVQSFIRNATTSTDR